MSKLKILGRLSSGLLFSIGLSIFALSIIYGLLFLIDDVSSEDTDTDEVVESRFTKEVYEQGVFSVSSDVEILTDNQTGCKYIMSTGWKKTSGMSVLLDKNGNPEGCAGIGE